MEVQNQKLSTKEVGWGVKKGFVTSTEELASDKWL